MKKEQSLHRTFHLSIILVSFLSVVCVGFFWISHEYRRFHKEAQILRDDFIAAQKAQVKQEVERVIAYVQYRRKSTEEALKADIRGRVYEALAVAHNLYYKYRDSRSDQEIIEIIKAALRPLHFNQDRGYYFVYDMEGNNLLLPHSPLLEGKNLWDLQDSKGLYTIRRFIDLIRENREGFLRWHWYKPGITDRMSEKIGFAAYFEPYEWWIGTGEYIEDFEEDIKSETLDWINQIRFGNNGYIFMYDFSGNTLAHFNRKHLGTNRWEYTDLGGMKVVQELIRVSQENEGGFLRYIASIKPTTGKPDEKLAFTMSVPDWEWMVGAGFYIDDIEKVIEAKRAALKDKVRQLILWITGVLILVLLMVSLLARLISQKIFFSLDLFSDFFRKSAFESEKIDVNKVHFSEFTALAAGANRMIEDQQKAQQALRESEDRLNLALDTTHQGTWDWDFRTDVILWDRRLRDILGFDPNKTEPHLSTWKKTVHPDDFTRVRATMIRHLKQETPYYEAEYRVRVPSGEWKWILDRGQVTQRDETGRAVRAVGTYMDITRQREAEQERERMEEQLARLKKMEAVGLLAGGVAHDLNNVLSGVVSYPDLILMDLPADSPIRNAVLTIRESGQKAAAIVQDLLTLARRGVIQREVVNLNTILQEYLDSPECSQLIQYHPGVAIQTDLASDLLNIEGSPVHLRKTVMNLVSNAAEAQPDGGAVTVSSENRYIDTPIRGYDTIQEGDYVVLTVTDRGTGISPEDLKRIFEPFYTKKVMGRSGTGLGMAVVWGAVQDHKGYINVESREGRGTVFELFFPATREALSEPDGRRSPASYAGNGETVLVVDDIREQREIAVSILNKLSYRPTAVASGEAAVEYMKTHSADLLVLDMIMEPGIDGLETYRRILEIHPGQKAVIASGFAETDRVRKAQELGAGAYIRKPYTVEKLGTAIETELARDAAEPTG
ncbi:MAG: cache domain-containing protein [Thermodesulfobacteriota bacterium]